MTCPSSVPEEPQTSRRGWAACDKAHVPSACMWAAVGEAKFRSGGGAVAAGLGGCGEWPHQLPRAHREKCVFYFPPIIAHPPSSGWNHSIPAATRGLETPVSYLHRGNTREVSL